MYIYIYIYVYIYTYMYICIQSPMGRVMQGGVFGHTNEGYMDSVHTLRGGGEVSPCYLCDLTRSCV